jgi:Trypsin-like peptidase domain
MNDEAKFMPCKQSVVEVFTRKDVGQPWKSVGTGVVVSDQQCVTCFHVLFPDENQEVQDARKVIQEGKIQVKVRFFPDGNGSGKADLTSSNELADNERLVSVTPISKMKECDLAILSWKGNRPVGGAIAVLSECDDLIAKKFRIYGFAKTGNVTSVRLEAGEFPDRAAYNNGFWEFNSDHVFPGFSGAPIFDENTTHVLGMFLGKVTADTRRCRVLGSSQIRKLCSEVDFEGYGVDHAGPRERIKKRVESCLEKDPLVRSAIASAFKLKCNDDSANICEQLLNWQSSVTEFARNFTQVITDLDKSNRKSTKKTAIDVYVAFLAGLFKQEIVRDLRLALRRGQKVLTLDTHSASIADLLFSAVDGGVDCLAIWHDDRNPLKHKHSIHVEGGPGIECSKGKAKLQEDIEQQMVECMGLKWKQYQAMRPEERQKRLDAMADVFVNDNRRLVMIDDSGLRDVTTGEVPNGYSALVIVRLVKPAEPDRKSQERALAPFQFVKDSFKPTRSARRNDGSRNNTRRRRK